MHSVMLALKQMSPNTSANSSLSLEMVFVPPKKSSHTSAIEQQDVCQGSVKMLKGFQPFAVLS